MTLRIFLFLSMAVFVTGCKLAVIVVEGGEVDFSGLGTCVAGNICIFDVTSPRWGGTFRAVPEKGWYFEKWNSGDRLLCGGSTRPICNLSFRGYEESEAVENMVASSEAFYLMPIFKPTKVTPLIIDGKEWLQPYDFIYYSYDQVSAVCPDGVCSGFLPGSTFDLTGYTWASADDVRALSNNYLTEGRVLFGDFVSYSPGYGNILFAMVSDSRYEGPESNQVYIAGTDDFTSLSILVVESGSDVPNSDTGIWFWR